MYAFLVLVALALGLFVVRQALDELIPVPLPAALDRIVTLAVAAGLAWMLGYSVFAAFGQELRAEWMHPLMTGVVLVAIGELVRAVVGPFSYRTEAAEPAAPATRAARAA